MLEARWRWLGVKTGVREKVRPAGAPSFEPLEPRLLLDANLPDIQSLLTCDAPSPEQAIYVDLDRRDGSAQADLSPVLTIEVAPCDETNQPAPTPVSSENAATQVGCGVVAENASPDSSGMMEDDIGGPVVSGHQDIVPRSETSSIEIRGPPAGTYSICDPNRDETLVVDLRSSAKVKTLWRYQRQFCTYDERFQQLGLMF